MDLNAIWFFLWGLLWAVFFMTDGFDLGIGVLYPVLGKSDSDKRIMLNIIGPLWDGNEVWLVAAGGVTFAAFPLVYAVMFSSLYTPLMLILFGLILRGVSLEFRSAMENKAWRRLWDACFVLGSFLPALLFGVAFANIFKGLPIDGLGLFHGNLFTLLNGYGLLGGILFLLFFMVHGASWTAFKSSGDLMERSESLAKKLWWPLLAAAAAFLGASAVSTNLYANYMAHPVLFLIPMLCVIFILGIRIYLGKKAHFKAWACSSGAIVTATFFGVIGLFPNLFPSSLNPGYHLTAYNASSTPLTLKIMLVVALIFVPIVIAYQAWAFHLFRDKVTEKDLAYEESY